jgi:hypothetical protein
MTRWLVVAVCSFGLVIGCGDDDSPAPRDGAAGKGGTGGTVRLDGSTGSGGSVGAGGTGTVDSGSGGKDGSTSLATCRSMAT